MRIGLVCEGDASASEIVFSGTAKRMFHSLKGQGVEVIPINSELTGLRRMAAAFFSFSTDRSRWRSKFRYGRAGAKLRTSSASAALGNMELDAVLQIGAVYDPPGDKPYAIYCDWNMALDAEEAKAGNGSSRSLSLEELESIGQDHARRYRNASMIFTISERLRQSFIDLYGIDPKRVMTAYAGPNFDMNLIEDKLRRPKPDAPPTVLFIAKEFKRKGGDTVAAAMKLVQNAIPEARLIFAGSEEVPEDLRELPNLLSLGLLDKSDPDQLDQLLNSYRISDVMVLPSRHDPFPTVIREAMFFGLPCVTSNIWAMPEMVVEGKTGFLVDPEDPKALADRLITLLNSEQLRRQYGQAARRRAEQMFDWSSVGKVLLSGLQPIVSEEVVNR